MNIEPGKNLIDCVFNGNAIDVRPPPPPKYTHTHTHTCAHLPLSPLKRGHTNFANDTTVSTPDRAKLGEGRARPLRAGGHLCERPWLGQRYRPMRARPQAVDARPRPLARHLGRDVTGAVLVVSMVVFSVLWCRCSNADTMLRQSDADPEAADEAADMEYCAATGSSVGGRAGGELSADGTLVRKYFYKQRLSRSGWKNFQKFS